MNIVYKFKVFLEDEDDEFLREIEIESNSTFEEFHYAILEAVGLQGEELASFYLCDSLWNKDKEITLLDMSEEENKIDIMSECKLKNYISDHDQKLIYEYDFLNMWTFHIELVKVKPPQPKTKYPLCVRKVGKLTPRSKTNNSFLPSDIEESDFGFSEKEIEAFEEDELAEGFGFESEEFSDEAEEQQF
jgi:hypothetical protein